MDINRFRQHYEEYVNYLNEVAGSGRVNLFTGRFETGPQEGKSARMLLTPEKKARTQARRAELEGDPKRADKIKRKIAAAKQNIIAQNYTNNGIREYIDYSDFEDELEEYIDYLVNEEYITDADVICDLIEENYIVEAQRSFIMTQFVRPALRYAVKSSRRYAKKLMKRGIKKVAKKIKETRSKKNQNEINEIYDQAVANENERRRHHRSTKRQLPNPDKTIDLEFHEGERFNVPYGKFRQNKVTGPIPPNINRRRSEHAKRTEAARESFLRTLAAEEELARADAEENARRGR